MGRCMDAWWYMNFRVVKLKGKRESKKGILNKDTHYLAMALLPHVS